MDNQERFNKVMEFFEKELSKEQCDIIKECLETKNRDLIDKIEPTDTKSEIWRSIIDNYEDKFLLRDIVYKLYTKERYFRECVGNVASDGVTRIISLHDLSNLSFVSELEYLDIVAKSYFDFKDPYYSKHCIHSLYLLSIDSLKQIYSETKSLLTKAFISVASLNKSKGLNFISVEEAELNVRNLLNSVDSEFNALVDSYNKSDVVPQELIDRYWSVIPDVPSHACSHIMTFMINKSDFFDKLFLIHISNKNLKTQFERYSGCCLPEDINNEYLKFIENNMNHFEMLFYTLCYTRELRDLIKEKYENMIPTEEQIKQEMLNTNIFKGHEDFIFGKTDDCSYCEVTPDANIEYFRQLFNIYCRCYTKDDFYFRFYILTTLKYPEEIAKLEFSHSHYLTIDHLGCHNNNRLIEVQSDIRDVLKFNFAPEYIFTILKAAFKEEDKTKKAWIKESISWKLCFSRTKFEELFIKDEFIEYLPKVYDSVEELINKQLCLLIMSEKPMLVKDFFVTIIDASATGLSICRKSYIRNPELAEGIVHLMNDKKAANKKFARAILELFPKYTDILNGVVAVETDIKAKKEEALGLDGLVKKLSSSSKKIEKITTHPLFCDLVVRNVDGNLVDDKYLIACLMGYAKTASEESETTDKLIQQLNKDDVNKLCSVLLTIFNEIYDSKTKWIPYFVANYSTGLEYEFQNLIYSIASNARSTSAVEATTALSKIKTLASAEVIDRLIRNVSHRRALIELKSKFSEAAKERNLTHEELRDKFIPTFNLDKGLSFDYGSRQFNVSLLQSGELQIIDSKGKEIKSLPTIGKTDDESLATIAKDKFKTLKDSLKLAIKLQSKRLVLAMTFDRRWSFEQWKTIHLDNPIMKQFAITLIWGIYKDNKLVNTFRYMEDGTINDINEEELTLKDEVIGLIHPIELNSDELTKWVNNLSDYEVKQSISQLDRPIHTPEDNELKTNKSSRSKTDSVNIYALDKNILSNNWERGEIEDYGYFTDYNLLNQEGSIVASLYFEGMSISFNNEMYKEVYSIEFHNVNNCSEVTPKLFSEVITHALKAVSSSK